MDTLKGANPLAGERVTFTEGKKVIKGTVTSVSILIDEGYYVAIGLILVGKTFMTVDMARVSLLMIDPPGLTDDTLDPELQKKKANPTAHLIKYTIDVLEVAVKETETASPQEIKSTVEDAIGRLVDINKLLDSRGI